ncbi:HAD family phosphatase [Streptomyces sp. ODS28]|uniref:HAD family hydrolase n=1 Tax=Streptomyces sp. ODS28 TaxID=3136688 RepID=UPI0031E78D67
MPSPAPGPLAALLCDMDGTLVDTERDWLAAVAARLGTRTDDPAVLPFAGLTLADGARMLAPHLPGLTEERAAELLGEDFSARVAAGVTVQPGALRLLEDAKALGVPVALVTASERPVADLVLDRLGRDRFAFSVAAGEAGRDKPHPDPYLRAARELGVSPGDCLAVEDTPTGAEAALAAGCRLLAVPTVPGIAAGPRTLLASSLEHVDLAGLTSADAP